MLASEQSLERVGADVLTDLRGRYAEPQRAYHTWDHITALLGWFDQRASELADPDAVFLAVLFHDAIYDPRRKDNETLSAALLAQTPLPGFSAASVARAVRLTEATAATVLTDQPPWAIISSPTQCCEVMVVQRRRRQTLAVQSFGIVCSSAAPKSDISPLTARTDGNPCAILMNGDQFPPLAA